MKKIIKIIKKIIHKTKTIILDTNTFNYKINKYISKEIQNLTLIDIGANRGGFFLELQNHFNNTNINALLIEPIPTIAFELKERFAKNQNAKIGQFALSNVIENKDFYINQCDVTSSLLTFKNGLQELNNIDTTLNRTINVKTNTLDNIMTEYHFGSKIIDIIKIDVQGYEDRVLLGAIETLKKTRFVWIEVSFKKLYNESCLFYDIYKILYNSNFILTEILDEFRSPKDELLQANCLFKNTNY